MTGWSITVPFGLNAWMRWEIIQRSASKLIQQRVGSTYTQEARFLGRPVLSEFEVIEYEPGRRVKITSTSGTFPITVTRVVEPGGDGGIRVGAVVEGDASGFYRLAEPFLKRMVQRSVQGDYERLKRILEGE